MWDHIRLTNILKYIKKYYKMTGLFMYTHTDSQFISLLQIELNNQTVRNTVFTVSEWLLHWYIQTTVYTDANKTSIDKNKTRNTD
jgi:hypothetical protein